MLKNARQAMAEIAEAERKLDIVIKNNGDGYVHISVTDRGVGLSEQSRQSVFTLGHLYLLKFPI